MSEDIKGEQVVSSGAASPPQSTPRKGHFRRFWWLYLLVFLIVAVVIIVPCVILVAVPRVAQGRINAATFTVDGISITNTTGTSFTMAINSSVNARSSTKATVSSFQGTMYLTDVDPPLPLLNLTFPSLSTGSTVLVNISQEVPITNMSAIVLFNTYLFTNKSVHVRLAGDTNVKVAGIARHYPVSFSKDVEMAGFNGFNNTTVTNPQVNPTANTNNFNATVIIPNPTIWTVLAGNLTFDTYFNKTNIGTTTIVDTTLSPGSNDVFISASVDQSAVLAALSQKPYCETGILDLELAGKAAQNRGQNITYLQEAFAAKNLTVPVDIGSAIKKALGFSIPCAA